MRRTVSLVITVLVVVSFLLACAAPSPTAAPTKPSAPAVAITAPAVPTSAPAAATTAPAIATKPAAAAPTAATVAMLKEDNWCVEPVIGYGLGEPPQYFLDGYNRYPRDVETLEAGRHYAEEFPRIEVGKYVGVLTAPLNKTPFEPDLVVIYCDTTQLSLLMLGRECKNGYSIKCALSSHAACLYGIVPPLLSGECQVAVPCRGDHYHAMAGDEEMIFTVPNNKLDDLMAGLRYVEKTGSKLPRAYTAHPEYQLPEAYAKIANMMGYLRS